MMHSDEHITSLPLDGRLRGAWGAVKGHSIVKLRDRSHLTSSMSPDMGCMVTNTAVHT